MYFYNDHDDLEKRGIYSYNFQTSEFRFLRKGRSIIDYKNGLILITEWVSDSNDDIFLYNTNSQGTINLTNSIFSNGYPKFQPK